MRRSLLGLLLAAATVLAARPADARVRVYPRPRHGYRGHVHGMVAFYPSGWYGGVSLLGLRILDQRGGPEQLQSGLGVGVYGGFRLSERLSLELGWQESFHNPARVATWYGSGVDYLVLDGWTADARIHLGRGETGTFDPFVQGGVGLYALSSQYFGLDSFGTGFQLGGGFDYHFAANWALGVRALYRGIAMGPPEGGPDDLFVSGASVEGSLALHF